MAETGQVATILSVMGSVATAFAGQVSQWVGLIFQSGNELLTLSIAMPLATVGIALLIRLLNRVHA